MVWSYAIVVDRIGEVLQEAAAWAESCDCHFSEPTLIGPTRHSRHARRKLFRDRSEFQDICPLAGKRAFCCAAGDLVRLFHTLAETAHSQLLSEPFFGGIEEADSSVLFRDFAAGRTYIIAMSEIKFGHWRQLPWVLFGISHPNHMIAVECARRSLQLAAGFEDRTHVHYLIGVLCLDGGLLNRQMKVFAQGQTNMLDLDELARVAAKFHFTMITERWVESRHAISQRVLRGAPNAGAVHLAYSGVIQSIRWILKTGNRETISSFIDCFARSNNIVAALTSLGFQQHPKISDMLKRGAAS